jgi:hypothetical protein
MKTLPRLVEPALSERLRVMPAVVVTSARQTGKSTLAAERVPGKRRCASLDLKASAPQPTIGKLVDDAMAAIERDNASLKGVLPKDYARPGLDQERLGQLVKPGERHRARRPGRARRIRSRSSRWLVQPDSELSFSRWAN